MGAKNARPGGPEGLPDLTARAYCARAGSVKTHPARKNSLFADFRLRREPAAPAAGSRQKNYGVTTGQAGTPAVVQTIRPWIAALIGVLAAM